MSFADGTVSRQAYNERIKLLSQTAQNFGVALVIAIVGNLFTSGFSLIVVFAALVAIFMFAMAHKVLGNLEGDEG